MVTKRWTGLVVVSVLAGSGAARANEPSKLSDRWTVPQQSQSPDERLSGALALAEDMLGTPQNGDVTGLEDETVAEASRGNIIWVNSAEPDIIWVDPDETAVAVADDGEQSEGPAVATFGKIIWVDPRDEGEEVEEADPQPAVATSDSQVVIVTDQQDPFDREEAAFEVASAQESSTSDVELTDSVVAEAPAATEPTNTVASAQMAATLPAIQTINVATTPPAAEAKLKDEPEASLPAVTASAEPAAKPVETTATIATAATEPAAKPVEATATIATAATEPAAKPVEATATIATVTEPAAKPVEATATIATVTEPAAKPVETTATVATVATEPAAKPVEATATIATATEPAAKPTEVEQVAVATEPTPATTDEVPATPVTMPEHATASVSRHAVYSPRAVETAPAAATTTLPASAVVTAAPDHGNVQTAAAVIPAVTKEPSANTAAVLPIVSSKPGAPRSVTIQVTAGEAQNAGRYQTHFDITVTETPQ